MNFAGLAAAQVATLFAVGAVVITAMYLLRMRRRQVVVPFAALWQRVTAESDTRRLWKKLRRMLSWLVQLILLALICLALGDPRPDAWLRDPATLAIVVDTSASMAGTHSEEGDELSETVTSRLQAAIARARSEVAALGPADRALVIAAGTEVRVPAPLSRDPGSLLRGLDGLGATKPGEADLPRALDLARNAVGDQPGGQILILTDGALDTASLAAIDRCIAGSITCQVKQFGGPPPNVAITAFAARRYPDDREHVEVLAEVQNLGEQPVSLTLAIEADGVSVGKNNLQLQPGARQTSTIRDVDAARTKLIARLLPADGTELDPDDRTRGGLGPADDDIAYAIVPPLRPLKVALVTDGTNLFLEAALLTLEDHIELSGVPMQQAAPDNPTIAEADVIVYDVGDHPLPDLPERNVVVFDPWRRPEASFPIARQNDIKRPFLTEQLKDHPLLDAIVLKDVNIGRGTSFVLDQGDQALVRSIGEPIVVLRSGAYQTVAIGFDLRQSDLPLRVAFPVFVANIINYFEQAMPGFVASVPVGARRPVKVASIGLNPSGLTAVEVVGPEPLEDNASATTPRETVPLQDGVFRLRALEPGFYRIVAADGPHAGSEARLAVNQASAAASDLRTRLPELSPEAVKDEAPTPVPLSEGPLWTLLIIAAAGLITVEWISYHRRVTV